MTRSARLTRRLLAIASCLAALGGTAVGAQEGAAAAAGDWTGYISLPNGRLDVAITLRQEAGVWLGTADIPAQGARGMPLGDVTVTGPAVSFRLLAGQVTPTFTGTVSDEGQRLAGTFTQGDNTFPFDLSRGSRPAAAGAAAAREWPGEAVSVETPTGTLHGTLRLPSGAGPHPTALLIAGSGPTDRNGNSAVLPGRNDSLGLLAEALAEAGVASLRYDKRGVGESAPAAPPESDMRLEIVVDDAVAWTEALRADARLSGLTIVGHSEGALIGMLAAQRAGADAFVSIAGIARRAPEVIRDQLRPQLPPTLWQESELILAALDAGRRVDLVPPALASLFRPSVQPYLISWFRYDPVDEMRNLRIPVLIAQGTTDMQVAVAEAQALEAARPHAMLAIIDGMNHVLKMVPDDPARQQASYSDPSLPVAPQLVTAIREFIATLPPRDATR